MNTQPATNEGDDEGHIHSDIFDRIDKTDDEGIDIVGLLAYGIYQQRKRSWIKDYKQKNSSLPSETQVRDYSFGQRDDALRALRGEAEAMLVQFSEVLIDDRTDEISKNAYNERTLLEISDLKSKIKKLAGYRHHIVGHVIGFFVLLLLSLLFVAGLNHEPSLKEAVRYVVGGTPSGNSPNSDAGSLPRTGDQPSPKPNR